MVLFDLDDTLYRELDFVHGGFAAAACLVTAATGRPQDEVVARMVALHARDGRGAIFDHLLEELDCPDPVLVRAMLLVYRSHPPRIAPFPDVLPVLDRLAADGIPLGILTDGLASVQRRKLEALGLEGRFAVIVPTGELGDGAAKPSPLGFQVALRLLGLPARRAGEAVYVANDSGKDFAGARAAGLRTVRVRDLPDVGGPGTPASPDQADDADVIADPFATLLDYL